MVKITPITDPAPVMELFMRSNLEIEEDEFERRVFLKGYKAENEEGVVIGGCALTEVDGHYIINGIAVDPEYRKTHIASDMLARCLEDARQMGAKEIILVARAPGFFRKNKFINVPDGEVPEGLFDCLSCPQYQKECFPEIMRLPL
ncbi:GNAT family N-acetyltransferase [Bacilliculturomica massiliensis]|uniref:GNAT family N-acetyltransferase n=1 Tax=Bacilliculturomica massiliensis TaxID=1917867 RepID=UPI0010320FD8|nr:GNAT family N-acetyltransferase [Bacilliculturomica massiliensis]